MRIENFENAFVRPLQIASKNKNKKKIIYIYTNNNNKNEIRTLYSRTTNPKARMNNSLLKSVNDCWNKERREFLKINTFRENLPLLYMYIVNRSRRRNHWHSDRLQYLKTH